MTEPATRPLRTWRPMAAWTAGILLALGLAWFVGAVVVPLLQVRAAVGRCAAEVESPSSDQVSLVSEVAPREVARLGGPERAARLLGIYLALPVWMTKHRESAVVMLGSSCDGYALPKLAELLQDANWHVRVIAILAMKNTAESDSGAAAALPKALEDPNWEVRHAAAMPSRRFRYETEAAIISLSKLLHDDHTVVRRDAAAELSRMGAKAEPVITSLTAALSDPDQDVRRLAAKALEGIRAAELPK